MTGSDKCFQEKLNRARGWSNRVGHFSREDRAGLLRREHLSRGLMEVMNESQGYQRGRAFQTEEIAHAKPLRWDRLCLPCLRNSEETRMVEQSK